MSTITGCEEEPTAHYYHATLHKFSMTARAAVINEFHSKSGNIAFNCAYITKNDLFSLSCPTSQGAFCDEILRETINRYVEQELEAAVREERNSEVQPFPESRLDWYERYEDREELGVDGHAHSEPQVRSRAVKTHTVSASDAEGNRLKFFRLKQLPESFTRRSLTHGNTKVQEILINGLTCRAVRWKAGEGYVFSGRDGASLVHNDSSREQVKLLPFPELRDTRDQTTLDTLTRKAAETISINRRQHIGTGPRVREWLHGVDQTTQIGSEEAADLPKETRKMIAAEEMHVIGRARVPKGYQPGTQDRDDSSDDESPRSVTKPGFAAMMLCRDSRSGLSGRETSVSDSSSDSGAFTITATGGPNKLPPSTPVSTHHSTNSRDRIGFQPTLASPQRTSERTADPASPAWVNYSTASSPGPRSIVAPSIQDHTEFVQHEKKYAKVDRSGLTADSHLTAKWELENRVPSNSKPAKVQAIMPRIRQSYARGTTEGTVANTLPGPSTPQTGKTLNTVPPMPDPLPAPDVRKVHKVPRPSARGQRSASASAPVPHEEQPRPHAFQQLLFGTVEEMAKSDADEAALAVLEARRLVVQFGQILLEAEEKSFGKKEASPPEVMQALLNLSTVKTHFHPRLTTSASDAEFLIKLLEADAIPDLIYEIRIRDAADVLLNCRIVGTEKSCFEVKTADHAPGYEYLHYPIHFWDARMSLLQPGVEYESISHKAIEYFIASMETEGHAPSFCAHVPFGQFVIEAVYAIRRFEDIKDGITRRVTEKRQLKQEHFGGVKHNFEAVARSDAELIDDQCLWWEAMLETDDLEKREELQDMATSVVEEIDGVGMENIGPWRIPDKDEGEKDAAPALLYDSLGRDYLAKMKAQA